MNRNRFINNLRFCLFIYQIVFVNREKKTPKANEGNRMKRQANVNIEPIQSVEIVACSTVNRLCVVLFFLVCLKFIWSRCFHRYLNRRYCHRCHSSTVTNDSNTKTSNDSIALKYSLYKYRVIRQFPSFCHLSHFSHSLSFHGLLFA